MDSKDPQPYVWNHINGSEKEKLERFAVSEICKGWPVYRDASEWANYRDLFVDGAKIWTTWSGAVDIDQFIKVSKEGKDRGEFIMHRECGALVDLNPENGRAIGKMKTTITQRFEYRGVPFDVDCDNEFVFWCLKTDKGWKCKYYKDFYVKDKVVTIRPPTVEDSNRLNELFTPARLAKFPKGYMYLAVAQEEVAGHPVLKGLATWAKGEEYYKLMYAAMKDWLDGKEPYLDWPEPEE